jgi:hypothetical protein
MNPSPRGTFGTRVSKLSLLPKASRAGNWILGENHPVAKIVVRPAGLVYVAPPRRSNVRTRCSFGSAPRAVCVVARREIRARGQFARDQASGDDRAVGDERTAKGVARVDSVSFGHGTNAVSPRSGSFPILAVQAGRTVQHAVWLRDIVVVAGAGESGLKRLCLSDTAPLDGSARPVASRCRCRGGSALRAPRIRDCRRPPWPIHSGHRRMAAWRSTHQWTGAPAGERERNTADAGAGA